MKKIIAVTLGLLLLVGCSSKISKNQKIKELSYPKYLKIIKRSDWGWLPLEKGKEEAKITKITIHHGGVEFGKDKDPANAVRTLQKWSRAEKKWIDIPYHFMIDLDGNIYETRPINYPGDTNTEYDPTGHALIEIMGNYEVQRFIEVQRKSLVNLIAFLVKEFNVPLTDIKTHKDYSKKTLCPGKNVYKYFLDGSIVKAVEAKLNELK